MELDRLEVPPKPRAERHYFITLVVVDISPLLGLELLLTKTKQWPVTKVVDTVLPDYQSYLASMEPLFGVLGFSL